MLAAGSDNPEIKTINTVGLKRANTSSETMQQIKDVFRLLYRQKKSLDDTMQIVRNWTGTISAEVLQLLEFVARQKEGVMGRAREALRHSAGDEDSAKRASLRKVA